MRFGYTIIYVPDVSASLDFYASAFGFGRRMLHETGAYGELETGEVILAFAHHDVGYLQFRTDHVMAHSSDKPLGTQITLLTDDVADAHRNALAAGATELAAPDVKSWGQTVSYVRCPDGSLVELATPFSL